MHRMWFLLFHFFDRASQSKLIRKQCDLVAQRPVSRDEMLTKYFRPQVSNLNYRDTFGVCLAPSMRTALPPCPSRPQEGRRRDGRNTIRPTLEHHDDTSSRQSRRGADMTGHGGTWVSTEAPGARGQGFLVRQQGLGLGLGLWPQAIHPNTGNHDASAQLVHYFQREADAVGVITVRLEVFAPLVHPSLCFLSSSCSMSTWVRALAGLWAHRRKSCSAFRTESCNWSPPFLL